MLGTSTLRVEKVSCIKVGSINKYLKSKDSNFLVKEMVKVSIIIPIYKVEDYIVRCIDSVLNQTYKNLEIILVNDCTPDKSMEKAQEYIEQSPMSKALTFVYLKHDRNRGLSAARNTGMDDATGEYVFFLDSDDAIEKDAIEILVNLAQEYQFPEMVVGSIRIEGNRADLSDRIFSDNYISGNDEIRRSYKDGIPYMMAVNKLLRLDFIRRNGFSFKEGIIHEDNPWSFFLANKLETMVLTSHVTYIYFLRSGSIMGVMSKTNKMKRYVSLMAILEEYNKGFIIGKLINSKDNRDYYTRLKYDYITEIFDDKGVSSKFKWKCLYDVLKEKWPLVFIAKWGELYVKTILWRLIHIHR